MSGRYQDWTESAEAWIADHGDEGDSSRRLILDPALRNVLGEVSGLRVLDVGCGHGRYTGHLAKRGAEAVGIEPAIPLLRHAHATYGPRFARADALALPFQDGSFDIVLSYLTLLDIEDHEGASREMARVCRPGGPDRDRHDLKSSVDERQVGEGRGRQPALSDGRQLHG